MDFIKNSEQAELFLDQEPASEPIYWRTPDLDGAVRTDRRRKAWKNYEGEMTCKYTRHKATSGAAATAATAAATEREKERRTLEGTSTIAKRGTEQRWAIDRGYVHMWRLEWREISGIIIRSDHMHIIEALKIHNKSDRLPKNRRKL